MRGPGGFLKNYQDRKGPGGRFFAKGSHLFQWPSDADRTAVIGVSIVSTGGLVSTRYVPLQFTASTLQHLLFGDFAIAFFLFSNVVLQVRQAALIDLRQACEYHFTE
jgi:hypothetical protein